MRDEETGSYWQQISGKAVSGPLKGRQLELVHSDELTFSLWRQENPGGTVLKPELQFESNYEPKDWEQRILKAPTVVDTKATEYGPRELMLGVERNGSARAYVLDHVLKQKLIQDWVGGTPVIVVVGPDGKSVRVFDSRIAGQNGVPEFYREPDSEKSSADRAILIDSPTGSKWTFQGCAVEGAAVGKCLQPIPAIKDYWFDWHLYHPNTTVHRQ